jgi:beta-glucosidase
MAQSSFTFLDSEAEHFINELIKTMTLEEKCGQLNQIRWNWSEEEENERKRNRINIKKGKVGSFLGVQGVEITRELQRLAVEESRLGIPLMFAQDVIHGWRTIFPVPLAESCSWNPAAVEQSSRIAAIEATAQGLHWTFAPMVDIARDPRWGRIVEGSGEDPYMGSVMAAARVRGFQGDDMGTSNTMLACAKHFCAYGGAEGGRDYNTVDISERTLQEIYLPPFYAAVRAGVKTVMGAFNEISGIPMHANKHLNIDVLRVEWEFEGILISDYTAIMELIHHGVAVDSTAAAFHAITAGVDIDMVSSIYLNYLPELINSGKLSMQLVDKAVYRVLSAKYQLGLFKDPFRYHDEKRERDQILTEDHRKHAKTIARESIVLLKNSDNLLPLSKEIDTLAVIGALAADQSAPLGSWQGAGRKEDVISILDGIKKTISGKSTVLYSPAYDPQTFKDSGGFYEALQTARKANFIILVLGEAAYMSGEANNRASIELPGDQIKLAKELSAINKPMVVLLMNGRPLAIPWLAEYVSAILETWFLGVEMGAAVADVLFGDFNPSGKLTSTFPRTTGQIPIYYNHKNTGRPARFDEHYTSKYLDIPWTPLFPFGHGLSYTNFEYSSIRLSKNSMNFSSKIEVTADVKNTGESAGHEVVQMYIRDITASITPVVKKLRGFKKIYLEPGQRQSIRFEITEEYLKFYNLDMEYLAEPGIFKVYVGGDSENCLEAQFILNAK